MFPDRPRVTYTRNPLDEVICQIRFPPILEIETEIPSRFQKLLGPKYPEYGTRVTGSGSLPLEVPIQVKAAFERLGVLGSAADRRTHHDFKSDHWTVTLARDFLALRTDKYETWDEFRTNLQEAYTTLQEVHPSAYTTRLGLRYRDVIRRSTLGVERMEWGKLLSPEIAGELASTAMENGQILELQRRMRADLGDGLSLALQHGLAQVPPDQESVFVIDADFFTEERINGSDVDRIWDSLDRANAHARRLFRWAISQELHDAMGPQPLTTT